MQDAECGSLNLSEQFALEACTAKKKNPMAWKGKSEPD
jgi:hypothetical protein